VSAVLQLLEDREGTVGVDRALLAARALRIAPGAGLGRARLGRLLAAMPRASLSGLALALALGLAAIGCRGGRCLPLGSGGRALLADPRSRLESTLPDLARQRGLRWSLERRRAGYTLVAVYRI